MDFEDTWFQYGGPTLWVFFPQRPSFSDLLTRLKID